MCGILGSISNTFSFSKSSLDCLAHRGPDDEGIFFEKPVMLGHRRLAIVDLSENGHQPMVSADGNYVLIYNGEIYNHLDIRQDLLQKGYVFRSGSDTETLLYAFIEYGTSVLEKLNGIFAFAIYDKQRQKVFIARDHFGVKPLYYYQDTNGFAFASELKVFRSLPGFDASIDTTALFYYLQVLYAPGELTPYKNVRKLLPGHFIEYNISSASFSTHSYYHIQFTETDTHFTEQQWAEQLEQKLLKAVDRQLMSDVPVGYFLSGGLDSSLIVALSKKSGRSNKQLNCFTIATGKDMQREGFSDDEMYAKKVADHLGVKLYVHTTNSSVLDDFDKFIWQLDEPQADPAPFHVYTIAKAARDNNIKVLLGGTAGDDIFSGYRRHQAIRFEKYFNLVSPFLGTAVRNIAGHFDTGNPAVRRIQKLTEDIGKNKADRYAGYFMWMREKNIKDLFVPDISRSLQNEVLPVEYFKQLLNQLPANTPDLNKLLYLELRTFLPDHNLSYTDKMSMAAGVETRVPYLDTELVAFANSMPVGLKMKGNTTKYLLKKVAEKYLPSEVIYRPKTGFGAPVRQWIKNDMKAMIAERLSVTEIKKKGYFDAQAVQKMIAENQNGKIDASYTIWSLLAIDSWITQFTNE